ncbi:MFS transporter [Paenibacillus tarimensis]
MREKVVKDMQLATLRGLNFSMYAIAAVLGPFLPLYFENQGYSSSQIGFLMMIGPLLAIFMQPVWGYLSDRLRTVKKIIFVLWSLTILSSIGLFNSGGYALTLCFVLLMFFFYMPSTPLLDSISVVAAERRGATYGSVRLFGSIGFTTVSLTGGIILAMIGGIANISFLLWAAWVLPMLLLLFLRDEPADGERMTLQSLKTLATNKSFLWFLLLVFLISVPHRMNDVMLGLYMKQLGATESMVGWAWALAAGVEIPVFILLYRYLNRVHEFTLIGLVGIIYCVRWFGYTVTDNPWVLLFLQAGAAVTFAVFWISAVHYTVRILPKQLGATGQSLLAMVFLGLSGITGGTVGGWLNDNYGGSSMYMFASIVALLAGIGFLGTEFASRRVRMRGGIG